MSEKTDMQAASVNPIVIRTVGMAEEIDVWLFETQHTDVPFACRDGELMLDHVREHLDDWMRSPIGSNETIELKVTYRSVTAEKFEEMRDHLLIS